MRLTLVIPGLIWPPSPEQHPARDIRLPGLARMLGRADPCRSPASDLHQWLAAACGLDAEPPWASLRLAGSGLDPGDAVWMCADPVHLRLLRECFVLADDDELAVDAGEAAAILETLNREFAPALEFVASAPAHWHLRLGEIPRLQTQPLSRAVGRRPDALLPQGPDAAAWMRRLNDIQVLLHDHPVNERREAAGRAAINSLWFWGCGRSPRAVRRPAAVIASAEAIARGLAAASGARAIALPASAADLPLDGAEDLLVILDALHAPALHRDEARWRSRLGEIGRDWIEPLEAAARRGRISRLALAAPGDAGGIELEYGRAQGWKLWRAPVPLCALDLSREAA